MSQNARPAFRRLFKVANRLCQALVFTTIAAYSLQAQPGIPIRGPYAEALSEIALMAPDARLDRLAAELRNPRSTRSAEQSLRGVARGRDAAAKAAACAVLSAHFRGSGRAGEAAAPVAPWRDATADNLRPNYIEAFLEHARSEALAGYPLAAFRALDFARTRTEGLAAVLVRVAYADCVAFAHDYEKALEWLKEARTLGDRWANPPSVSEGSRAARPSGAERWPQLRALIGRRIERMRFLAASDKWGDDYALYLFAQEAANATHALFRDLTDIARVYPQAGAGRTRVPGADFEMALALYDLLAGEHSGTAFAEAAGFERALCLAHLGHPREALSALEQFVAEAPLGLYRGDALLAQGDLALQTYWNPEEARRRYNQTLEWCDRAESLREGARLYAVPEKAASITAPPAGWHSLDKHGILRVQSFTPGTVVNQLSAPWHLNRLRSETLFRLGFLDALDGKWSLAAEQWRKVATYDPVLAKAQDKRYFNSLRRLEQAASKGYFVGHDEEARGIPPRLRPALLWADFLHMREMSEAATSLYNRLYQAADARGDGTVATRAALGLLLRWYAEAGRDSKGQAETLARATKLGETVLAKYPSAPAAAYVALMCAKSTPCPTIQERPALAKVFGRVSARWPRSRHVAEARYWVIYLTVLPENAVESLPAIERYRKDFPAETAYYRFLKRHVELMREFHEGRKPQPTQAR